MAWGCRCFLFILGDGIAHGGWRLALPAFSDGHAPAGSKGTVCDFEARGSLLALQFGADDKAHDARDNSRFVPCSDDLSAGLMLADDAVQNVVENLVGRQGVLVNLAGLKLCARGLGDDIGGDDFITADRQAKDIAVLLIEPLAEAEDFGFGQVGDGSESAVHIAVEGAVAHGHFRFVASGDQEIAKFVGDGHQ